MSPFACYIESLIKLHAHIEETNNDESDYADGLRDLMDHHWRGMSDEDKELAGRVSARLTSAYRMSKHDHM